MCLLVHVLLYHWKSIHIRSYGRIKWHRWRYMAARSGYIFIYRWQLVICSCAHLTGLSVCVCVCVCMHTQGVRSKWGVKRFQLKLIHCVYIACSDRCVCVSPLVCARGRNREKAASVRRRLISIDESGEITGEGWRWSGECRPVRFSKKKKKQSTRRHSGMQHTNETRLNEFQSVVHRLCRPFSPLTAQHILAFRSHSHNANVDM